MRGCTERRFTSRAPRAREGAVRDALDGDAEHRRGHHRGERADDARQDRMLRPAEQLMKKSPMYAAIMNTSLCAKLMSFSTP